MWELAARCTWGRARRMHWPSMAFPHALHLQKSSMKWNLQYLTTGNTQYTRHKGNGREEKGWGRGVDVESAVR